MKRFHTFAPQKGHKQIENEYKTWQFAYFFFTFVGRIATKLLFKILFGIT